MLVQKDRVRLFGMGVSDVAAGGVDSASEISATLSPWREGSLWEKEINADSNDLQVNT